MPHIMFFAKCCKIFICGLNNFFERCLVFPLKMQCGWKQKLSASLILKSGTVSAMSHMLILFQNVIKFSFAGWTNFLSVFKYSRPLFSLPLIHAMQIKAKVFNVFSIKVGNSFRHDSYACFLQNVVKFSFVGWTNFSSVLNYSGALFSLPLIDTM